MNPSRMLHLIVLTLAVPALARADSPEIVARGEYLVSIMSCNDCHTPFAMGPDGPAPDMTRMLSGHPQDMTMPPAPTNLEMPWMGVFAATMTAWVGPWGVSYPANLTPDDETGLGKWTEETFAAALRTGRHLGRGRQILPPMPIPATAAPTDEDMHALFAYLQSIPPIRNRVPDPAPPAAAVH